ncbi:transcription elongation factor A protein-like 1 [Sorex fumeus]|uniref:transcription elongation factor A protein-like 1 n=1 Tax=Sorex fumeus TaxID=62283 RepID=UPI0024ACE7C2|nr:transcription elongation factor A protein-like 1 [Sorex fumeus]
MEKASVENGQPLSTAQTEEVGQPLAPSSPVKEPAGEPVGEPAGMPVPEPASEPAQEPVREPAREPAGEPILEPAGKPGREPTGELAEEPSEEEPSEEEEEEDEDEDEEEEDEEEEDEEEDFFPEELLPELLPEMLSAEERRPLERLSRKDLFEAHPPMEQPPCGVGKHKLEEGSFKERLARSRPQFSGDIHGRNLSNEEMIKVAEEMEEMKRVRNKLMIMHWKARRNRPYPI